MNTDYTDEREVITAKERVNQLEGDFLTNLMAKTGKKLTPSAKPQLSPKSASSNSVVTSHTNTEEFLSELYDIRDNLIDMFSQTELGSCLSKNMTAQINRVGNCIRKLGGDVEAKFDPLQHVSGLKVPDLHKNAERVIETTKQCYLLGKVVDSEISGAGKIVITFEGVNKDIRYSAKGTVGVKTGEWNGNEAIDYVHTPGEGKMSVKVYSSGKWEDKSDHYDVLWELVEEDASKKVVARGDEIGKKAVAKEEVEEKLENNLGEINDDFPIEEK